MSATWYDEDDAPDDSLITLIGGCALLVALFVPMALGAVVGVVHAVGRVLS